MRPDTGLAFVYSLLLMDAACVRRRLTADSRAPNCNHLVVDVSGGNCIVVLGVAIVRATELT